jgi:hypothetical protein
MVGGHWSQVNAQDIEHKFLINEATKPIITLEKYTQYINHRQVIINELLEKKRLITDLIKLEVISRDLDRK